MGIGEVFENKMGKGGLVEVKENENFQLKGFDFFYFFLFFIFFSNECTYCISSFNHFILFS